MGMIETTVDIPAEHQANVFGQFDAFENPVLTDADAESAIFHSPTYR